MKLSEGVVQLKRTGKTQKSIATALGVSRQAVAKWFAGKSVPTRPVRECALEGFGVALEAWEVAATVEAVAEQLPSEPAHARIVVRCSRCAPCAECARAEVVAVAMR